MKIEMNELELQDILRENSLLQERVLNDLVRVADQIEHACKFLPDNSSVETKVSGGTLNAFELNKVTRDNISSLISEFRVTRKQLDNVVKALTLSKK